MIYGDDGGLLTTTGYIMGYVKYDKHVQTSMVSNGLTWVLPNNIIEKLQAVGKA